MEDLFKIDKIDGKGFGWIALQDIKGGTLIYEEKPQFVMKNKRINSTDTSCFADGGGVLDRNPSDLMNSYYSRLSNCGTHRISILDGRILGN